MTGYLKRNQWMSKATLLVLSLIMMYPILWWTGASLKSNQEISDPGLFSSNPQWSNFTEGWNAISNYSFTKFYLNTFELVGGVIILSLLSASLVAYGFARLNFPLKGFWFALVLSTLMLPHQVQVVPQYIMFHQFGWVNTYLPFFAPNAASVGIGGSFSIFLLVQFIRGIPRELDESAKMDGCSLFGIYWRIILPLMKPALVTVIIYNFLWNWDDFFGQLLYISSISKYTVGLALKLFIDAQAANQWGQLIAMSLVSVMPAVLVFLWAQRYFVEGIASVGIKG